MLRGGRDVAVSSSSKYIILRKTKNTETLNSLDEQISDQVHKWAEFTRAILQAEQNGHPIHTVRYEEMLNNPYSALKGFPQHIRPDIS